MRRSILFTAGAISLGAIAMAALWAFHGKADPRRPDIVLVVIDTLRRDHVGAYGYGRQTTPAIDALAAANVTFANAYANSNWTKPSVASLLTGLHVSQHGVTHVVTSQAGEPPMTQRLPDEVTTLAEAARSKGYHTVGVVDNVHISAKLGFSQGFDVWEENSHASTTVTNDALYRLKGVKKPFFLYVHYFDPHAPYYPNRLFESRGDIAPELIESESTDYRWSTYTYGVDRGIIGLSPIERERLVDLYDGDIRSVDIGIARVLATLKKMGAYDNAWIIITADHGEMFGEGGRLTHPHDCFANPQMRVPLIMKMPKALGVRERIVADQVQLVDIAPTIMGYLGAPIPPGMIGANLLSAIRDGQPLPARAVAAESESGRMLLTGGVKYVEVPTKAGIFEWAYDERRDPLDEQGTADPTLAADLRTKADMFASEARRRQTVKAASGVALSSEEVERMKTLGYIH